MQNSIAHGRRFAVRTVIFQLGIVGLVGLGFCIAGWRAGSSAWLGGMVVVLGNAVFAWRLFADGVAPLRRIARSVYAAEILKWVWLGLALYFAIAILKTPFVPFIVGIIAAQVAFWLAVAVIR